MFGIEVAKVGPARNEGFPRLPNIFELSRLEELFMVVLVAPAPTLLDQVVSLNNNNSDPDHACRERILDLLNGQRQQEFREVQISTERGIVTLRGRVASFYLRQLCIRCCQQVVGVHINDQLQVGAG